MTPSSFFVSHKFSRKRSGISPVISTTIILAITIVLGLSLWSFANSGVSTATQNYAEVVTQYGQFTADKYVIANIDFDNPSSDDISFWIFNSGKTTTTISSVVVVCRDCTSAFDPDPNPILLRGTVPDPADPLDCAMCVKKHTLEKFSFDTGTTIQSGKTYELTVLSETGASQTFLKKSD